MQTIVSGTTRSILELQDFARLSVTNEDLDYEQEQEHEDVYDIDAPGQGLPKIRQVNQVSYNPDHLTQVQVPAPAHPDSVFAPSQRATVQHLNSFNARLRTARRPQQVAEPTPFWSPDPPEASMPSQVTSEDRPIPASTPRKTEIATINDEDKDWDYVNDDLEDFFATSFPAAAKRAEKLQAVPPSTKKAFSEFDDEEEEEQEGEGEEEQQQNSSDEDFVMPSIETESCHNVFVSNSRGDLLCGLTEHAAGESPPTETPSKPPRKVVSSRYLFQSDHASRGSMNVTSSSQTGPANRARMSSAAKTPKSTNTSRAQAQSFERPRPVIDLTRLDTSHARNTVATSKTSAGRRQQSRSNPKPGTTIRTKVPVIVRKTIADYSV